MEKTLGQCLDDLYLLGQVQGEHNINWADEYNLLEHSQNYYEMIKAIGLEYGVECGDLSIKDGYLLDEMAFELHEKVKDEIRDRIEISQ